MNTPTLSQLADIGAAAAHNALPVIEMSVCVTPSSVYWEPERPAREAFVRAVLDAVGYKLPVDPEREAFEKRAAGLVLPDKPGAFEAWKAGRAARDKETALDKQPAPETFEAHGLTWFKHTPGDPCPCNPDDRIQVLISYELRGHFHPGVEAAVNWGDRWESAEGEYALIGWRYADAP